MRRLLFLLIIISFQYTYVGTTENRFTPIHYTG